MSGIISYVKRIGVWLCIVIACETIMIITMMLNKIPFAEIGYGILCHVGSPGQDTDRSTAASASE